LYSLVADLDRSLVVAGINGVVAAPVRYSSPPIVRVGSDVTTGINDDTRSSSGHQITLPDPAVYTA
jgi:hypothetical protein